MKPKTATNNTRPNKPLNVTHKNTIHNENIKKERKGIESKYGVFQRLKALKEV